MLIPLSDLQTSDPDLYELVQEAIEVAEAGGALMLPVETDSR